jgi:hypothetical protein
MRGCSRAIAEIPERFDRAFDRWRELYRAVEEQMSRAGRLRRSARDRDTQDSARRAYEEAERQRNLLLQIGVEYEESDFYPYRYLACEGFLPGYNFPHAPLAGMGAAQGGRVYRAPAMRSPCASSPPRASSITRATSGRSGR